jgi:hypothetical protein
MTAQDFDSNELQLLAEGLHRLREVKMDAHEAIVKVPGHECFTPADFGVPTIDATLAKITAAYELVPL